MALAEGGGFQAFARDGDLDVEVSAHGVADLFGFPEDGVRLFLGRLDVEHPVRSDDFADGRDERAEIAFLTRDDGGIGCNARDGIEFAAGADGVEIGGIKKI